MLLRVDVFFREREEFIIVDPFAHLLKDVESGLTTPENSAGAFSDTDGISGTETISAENLVSFNQQLVILYQSGANIDRVDSFDHLFSTRYGFEVAAFGYHSARDAVMMFIRDRLEEHVGSKDRDTQSPHPVSLNREPAFRGKRFEDGFDFCAGLHELVGGEVTDIPGSDGKDIFTEQGQLVVHHFLYDGRGVHTWQIIIFKGRHEGYGSGGDDEVFGVDKTDLSGTDVLHGYSSPFEDIPYG